MPTFNWSFWYQFIDPFSRPKAGKNKEKERQKMDNNAELKVTVGAVKAAAEQCPQARAALAAIFPDALSPKGMHIWQEGVPETQEAVYVKLMYSNSTPGAVKVVLVNSNGTKVSNLVLLTREGSRNLKVTSDDVDVEAETGRYVNLGN